jgi:hypothetical protein
VTELTVRPSRRRRLERLGSVINTRCVPARGSHPLRRVPHHNSTYVADHPRTTLRQSARPIPRPHRSRRVVRQLRTRPGSQIQAAHARRGIVPPQRLTARVPLPGRPATRRPRRLASTRTTRSRMWNPVIACLISFFLPGAVGLVWRRRNR